MKISLIICTKNRSAQLQKCLAQLERVDPPDTPVEVVIVDNGSTDLTSQVIHQHAGSSKWPTKICHVACGGLAAARNGGVRLSSGDLLCFTDDDCYLERGYFNHVARLIDPSSCQYGSGQILLYDRNDDERVATLRLDRMAWIPPHTQVIPAGVIQGANMFFLRPVFEKAGLFCENMGAGTPFPCEDIEMACRASRHGFSGALFPGISVYHHHGRKRGGSAAEGALAAYDIGRGAYYASLLSMGVSQAWDHWGRSALRQTRSSTRNELMQLARELRGAAQYLEFLADQPAPREDHLPSVSGDTSRWR